MVLCEKSVLAGFCLCLTEFGFFHSGWRGLSWGSRKRFVTGQLVLKDAGHTGQHRLGLRRSAGRVADKRVQGNPQP